MQEAHQLYDRNTSHWNVPHLFSWHYFQHDIRTGNWINDYHPGLTQPRSCNHHSHSNLVVTFIQNGHHPSRVEIVASWADHHALQSINNSLIEYVTSNHSCLQPSTNGVTQYIEIHRADLDLAVCTELALLLTQTSSLNLLSVSNSGYIKPAVCHLGQWRGLKQLAHLCSNCKLISIRGAGKAHSGCFLRNITIKVSGVFHVRREHHAHILATTRFWLFSMSPATVRHLAEISTERWLGFSN